MDKVTYIANAGILLELQDKKILIDGLCNSILPYYKSTPAELREKIIMGISPFDHIDVLLFTHHHSDHFNSKYTSDLLSNNKSVCMICTPEVISELCRKHCNVGNSKLIQPKVSLGSIEKIETHGVQIQIISMLHDGKEYGNIHNYAYVIEAKGKKVLHVGDAKPIRENYINANLLQQNIDLLIVPFTYICLPAAREVIKLYIKPKKIAVVHLPYKELDTNGWINATMKSYQGIEKEFTETFFLDNVGEYINLLS